MRHERTSDSWFISDEDGIYHVQLESFEMARNLGAAAKTFSPITKLKVKNPCYLNFEAPQVSETHSTTPSTIV